VPYEMRFYVCRDNESLAGVSRLLAGPGVDMFGRHGIDVITAWRPGLGGWSNVLAYLCLFESLGAGASAWQAVATDQQWTADKNHLAKTLGAPPVQSIRSWWLTAEESSVAVNAVRRHRGLSVVGYWEPAALQTSSMTEILAGTGPSLLLSPILGTRLHVSVHQPAPTSAGWDDAATLASRLRQLMAGGGYLVIKRNAGWFQTDTEEET
jgi:NIPSNAP